MFLPSLVFVPNVLAVFTFFRGGAAFVHVFFFYPSTLSSHSAPFIPFSFFIFRFLFRSLVPPPCWWSASLTLLLFLNLFLSLDNLSPILLLRSPVFYSLFLIPSYPIVYVRPPLCYCFLNVSSHLTDFFPFCFSVFWFSFSNFQSLLPFCLRLSPVLLSFINVFLSLGNLLPILLFRITVFVFVFIKFLFPCVICVCPTFFCLVVKLSPSTWQPPSYSLSCYPHFLFFSFLCPSSPRICALPPFSYLLYFFIAP